MQYRTVYSFNHYIFNAFFKKWYEISISCQEIFVNWSGSSDKIFHFLREWKAPTTLASCVNTVLYYRSVIRIANCSDVFHKTSFDNKFFLDCTYYIYKLHSYLSHYFCTYIYKFLFVERAKLFIRMFSLLFTFPWKKFI